MSNEKGSLMGVLASSAEKPIFVVSVGRSGSSIFADEFSYHPHVSFLSQFADRYPNKPEYNRRLMTLLSFRGIGKLVRSKISNSEAYGFWEHHSTGFSRPTRDLRSDDVTAKKKRDLRRAVTLSISPRRPRFMAKITGWSRIGFLDEIFHDAVFVHIVRDGRDVANSLLNIDFWKGWEGPQNWRLGELSEVQQIEWEKYNKSFVILAAIFWKKSLTGILNASAALPKNRFLQIKYEDFVSDPCQIFEQVLDHCDLCMTNSFAAHVSSLQLKTDSIGRYRRDLTVSQQELLERFLKEDLIRSGYIGGD